jgi:hypothetical protein
MESSGLVPAEPCDYRSMKRTIARNAELRSTSRATGGEHL